MASVKRLFRDGIHSEGQVLTLSLPEMHTNTELILFAKELKGNFEGWK